jgi:crossover junction endodeoxyribonuclease RusA
MKIVINEIPPSNNKFIGRNVRWQYQEEKQKWHWLMKAKIKERPKKPFEKAEITIHYYFKDKRKRDPDNYSGKMILDPLVKEKIIIDDNFSVITLILKAGYDKENPRTEIEIKEISGDD